MLNPMFHPAIAFSSFFFFIPLSVDYFEFKGEPSVKLTTFKLGMSPFLHSFAILN